MSKSNRPLQFPSPAAGRNASAAAVPGGRFHPDGVIPKGDWIWVFGSNEKGVHGKGAAKVAHVSFGAEYGVGRGPTGRAYAIPTKRRPSMDDKDLVPLAQIQVSIEAFIDYASANKHLRFFVTAVGTGLAGYKDEQIGPMFAGAPDNCSLPQQWAPFVGAGAEAHKLAA